LVELAEVATDDALAQLTVVADDITARLAEYRGKDGRNVTVGALQARLALTSSLIDRCKTRRGDP